MIQATCKRDSEPLIARLCNKGQHSEVLVYTYLLVTLRTWRSWHPPSKSPLQTLSNKTVVIEARIKFGKRVKIDINNAKLIDKKMSDLRRERGRKARQDISADQKVGVTKRYLRCIRVEPQPSTIDWLLKHCRVVALTALCTFTRSFTTAADVPMSFYRIGAIARRKELIDL